MNKILSSPICKIPWFMWYCKLSYEIHDVDQLLVAIFSVIMLISIIIRRGQGKWNDGS